MQLQFYSECKLLSYRSHYLHTIASYRPIMLIFMLNTKQVQLAMQLCGHICMQYSQGAYSYVVSQLLVLHRELCAAFIEYAETIAFNQLQVPVCCLSHTQKVRRLCLWVTRKWKFPVLAKNMGEYIKPEAIMLLILPIIPFRNSHNFYPLFLFYSHDITYYSCYIL